MKFFKFNRSGEITAVSNQPFLLKLLPMRVLPVGSPKTRNMGTIRVPAESETLLSSIFSIRPTSSSEADAAALASFKRLIHYKMLDLLQTIA